MGRNDVGYFGILPAEVRYDKKLLPNAKLLFVEITALCRKDGYCWATNGYFAELFGAQERTIQRWIKLLCDKGYCYTVLKTFRYEDGTIKKVRYICISKNAADALEELNLDHTDKEVSDHHDISVQNHHDTDVVLNNINNESDKMDTNVSIGETPQTYGKPEINQLFETWERTTGLPITSNKTKNRYACNNLLKQYGVNGVEKLIRVVERAQLDQYAPRVADFCDLQAKLNQLLVWAKGQTTNSRVISVEDF